MAILCRKMYVAFEGRRFVRRIVVQAFMLHSLRYSSTWSHFSVLPPLPLLDGGCTDIAYPDWRLRELNLGTRKHAPSEIRVQVTRFILVFADKGRVSSRIFILPFSSSCFGSFHFRAMRKCLILSRERAFIHSEWFYPICTIITDETRT